MSISHDNVTAFYDAVRALSYKEMLEVAMEISGQIVPPDEQLTEDGPNGQEVADALVAAAEGKPSNERPTRGIP